MGRPTPDDSLPQHVAEAIPQTVPNEVHYAWWSEGGDRAGNCSWNSAHLQSDETYHQDHVRPRHHRRHRKEVGKLPIGHPAIGSDEVMDIRESREESAEALRAWPRDGQCSVIPASWRRSITDDQIMARRDRTARRPGIWFSLKRFAHLNKASFRKVVLGLVLRGS
jgi:hypothetical protein